MRTGSTAAAQNRVALRLAAREARRHPWRSALVMVLVAVPVAGMVLASTLFRTDTRSALESWDAEFGLADVVADGMTTLPEPGQDPAEVREAIAVAVRDATGFDLDALGPNAVTTTAFAYGGFRSADAAARTVVQAVDLDHPIWADRYVLLGGRPPVEPTEVALSAGLARRFSVDIGEPMVLQRPDVTLTLTGIVEDTDCLACDVLYGPAEATNPVFEALGASFGRLLIDVGAPDPDLLRPLMAERGAQVRPLPELADLFTDPDAADQVAWSVVIGALVLAVVGIVIAAAFAAGARGQLVTLGLLSATGAPARVLRRVLVLQGTVTGMAGTALGLAVSGTALLAGQPLAERIFNRRIDGFEVGVAELVAIVAVGVAGATIAALVPSRTVATVPTLTALAGRRPLGRVGAGFTLRGAGAMVSGFFLLVVAASGAPGPGSGAGTVLSLGAVVGGCLVLFGAAALTPAMVQRLEPLARRSQGAVRLASRGLARNRTRSGAIVAAVAAAGALAVGGTSLARVAFDDVSERMQVHPDVVVISADRYASDDVEHLAVPDDAIATVAAALSDPVVAPLDRVRTQVTVEGDGYRFSADEVLVVDDDAARALGLDAGSRARLVEDGMIVLAFDLDTGRAAVAGFPGLDARRIQVVQSRWGTYEANGMLVAPALADDLVAAGAVVEPGPVVVRDRDGVDDLERFDLEDLGATAGGVATTTGADGVAVSLTTGFDLLTFDRSVIELALAALSVLFALLVVGIGLGLAAADDRHERQQLSVAGAGPSTLSQVSGIQAGLLAALGFVLAVPVGFLPVLAVVGALDRGAAPFPTDTVALLLVAVPVLAFVGARVVTAIGGRLRPLRISRAAFE